MKKEIQRDSKGLVKIMFDELEKLDNGESTPQQARSKSAVANTIIAIKRLEMDFARFVTDSRSDKEDNSSLKSLPMGN